MRPVIWSNPVNRRHPLNRGLVSWWLNVPHWQGGTVFRDLMGLNDGTLTNMDPATDWIGPRGRPGGRGALDFDGSDDYVNMPAFPLISEPFTVSGWFRHDNDDLEIICTHDDGTNNGWRVQTGQVSDPDTLTFTFGAIAAYSFTSLTIGPNWSFFAVTVQGTTAIGYLDGLSESLTVDTQIGTPDQFEIGRIEFAGGFEFTGSIDDVRIYNRVLSAAEVAEYYQLSQQFYPGLLNRLSMRGIKAPVAVALPKGSLALTGVGI